MSIPGRIFFILGAFGAMQSANFVRLAETDAYTLAAWRLVVAAILFVVIYPSAIKALPLLSIRNIALLCGNGAGFALHLIFWNLGVQHTSIAYATLFFSLNPFIVALLAWWWLGEGVSVLFFQAVALGTIGVAIMAFTPGISTQDMHWLGNLYAFASGIFFSFYLVFSRALRSKLNMRIYLTNTYLISSLITASIAYSYSGSIVSFFTLSNSTWLSIILLAFISTCLGHSSYQYGLRFLKARQIGFVTMLEPLVAGVVAHLAWNESLSNSAILGYIFITTGLLLLFRESKPNTMQNLHHKALKT